ncbi:hypothetical protein Rsub_04459 [Raphidocelis subcapitata]|uniref:Uncharacterized protein n=1 Tax=Raphidocelis subcapitata TaxID=307507 RepID=A0A2V0NZK7_9CHLO|nr:hypothetical protein Rsub_04459 [Raphidocelis subcapitata]|eukprot:GBF92112.1 hypothetical protein Rsub_04459 [Raphidocelis subcapitata]
MAAAAGPAPDPAAALPSKEAFELTGHEGAVLNVRLNPAGTYCLSCGKDRTVRLWNPHKGIPIKTYSGHGYEARDASVSRDNSQFASVGGDKQVFLWDVGSGKVVRKFRGHDAAINAVVHAASDDVLVTGGYDQCIRAWDCRSRSTEPIQTMRAFKDDVTTVAARGHEVLGGSVDGTLRRFDVRMGRAYTDDLRHPVTAAVYTGDGLCLLAACLDSTLRLVDKETGELLASYRGHTHTGVKMGCALMPGDAFVVGASEDGRVFYWELVEAALAKSFPAHKGAVCGVAAHPAGAFLLTAGADGAVRVWGC